jgi:hypothetical protein
MTNMKSLDYGNGEFEKKTQETFEDNYKLTYHLAQILLSRTNKQIQRSLTRGLWWGVIADFQMIN